MNSNILEWLEGVIKWANISETYIPFTRTAIIIVFIALIAWLSDTISKKLLLKVIRRIVSRTKNTWDDTLLNKKVFNRLAHLAPIFVIYYFTHILLSESFPDTANTIQNILEITGIIIVTLVINSVIDVAGDIAESYSVSQKKPIKGYLQLAKIFVYFIAILFAISIGFDKSIGKLLTGLGAMAAVLLLVFKDTLLGLTASVQLSSNNMVKIGDWISMPSHNADGTVLDITLNTVKVQNWDMTISTIPTYALISNSFQNWVGMEESGGRRIKRAINIDMNSIVFCSSDIIDDIKSKITKCEFINNLDTPDNPIDTESTTNNHTNIGLFRKYLESFLDRHPMINEDMTFLVRQLKPTERGMPIEIYVFSKDQRWAQYEAIQADIFDHIIAVLPLFKLRVFQNPTGYDIEKLTSGK
ncbi:MAG: mechanosensitive ion channel family protein [Bacteroidales bacterium]|jgi:miniconductance mechanosensitive channel|nr:mechanosensitive ion channel family protein [Bacteroidales bacterium]